MSYEYQITIGNEEIYFEVENDPEDVLTFSWNEWYEYNDPRDFD